MGNQATIYDRYGGFSQISKVVMRLYDVILDSPTIGDFFADVDMAAQIDHQTKFVAYLMGGPASISDNRLMASHHGLGITHDHFDELKAIFEAVLSEFAFEGRDIEVVLAAIEERRELIVRKDGD